MIKCCTEGIKEFCKRDIYGTRISAYLDVYGNDMSNAFFYVQKTDSDEISAVIGKVFGDATLCCTDEADFEEISEFLSLLGYRSLLCDKRIRERISADFSEYGFVMTFEREKRDIKKHDTLTYGDKDFEYKEVYSLLEECSFSLPEYGEWLSDMALRAKKGVSKTLYIRDNGKAVSTASALFITDSAVYLGAVATSESYRGKGTAGNLVLSLCSRDKRVNILCKEHRVGFYESLGFKRDGEWSL